MAKPSIVPRWAHLAAAARKVAPSAGKQEQGWDAGEMPPAEFFNWWQNYVGEWAKYLDELTGEALTWSADHVFNAIVKLAQIESTGINEWDPVLSTHAAAPATRRCLWRVLVSAGVYARLYAHTDGRFEVTHNARWNGAAWFADNAALPLTRAKLGANATIAKVAAAASTTDAAFDAACVNLSAEGKTAGDVLIADGLGGAAFGSTVIGRLQVAVGAGPAFAVSASTVTIGGVVCRPSFYKDPSGRVWLGGAATIFAGGQPIFTLPAGFRPGRTIRYRVEGSAAAGEQIEITSAGVVQLGAIAGGQKYVEFAGVTFHPSDT
jgi:hypothetical protein